MLDDGDKVQSDFGPQRKQEWVNWYLIDYNYMRVVRVALSLTWARLREKE